MTQISIKESSDIILSIYKLVEDKNWNKLRIYYFEIKEKYKLPDFILNIPEDIYCENKKNKTLHKLLGFDDSGIDTNTCRVLLYFRKYYPEFMGWY